MNSLSRIVQQNDSFHIVWGAEQLLILTLGLPGSGKTTWAKSIIATFKGSRLDDGSDKFVRVNRDEIRLSLGFKYDPRREGEVTAIEDAMIESALARGCTVINDNTFLNPTHVEARRKQARKYGVKVLINDDFMKVSVKECIKRDLMRDASVGKDVIEELYFKYWSYLTKPTNLGNRYSIMCDLDGTFAMIPKGSNPYDRDFTKDIVNVPVRMILASAYYRECSVIFMSGRDEKYRAQTEEWLQRPDVWAAGRYGLYMRPEGDKRSDDIVKKELYMTHVQPSNYMVSLVLDDRPSVVRMWRAECGLPVFQVAPNIEF